MSVTQLSPERIRAETDLRIRRALAKIQQAQYELNDACSELSAICGGIPVWKATARTSDAVRSLWYRVDALRTKARHQKQLRVRLDDTNIAGIIAREQHQQTEK